MSRRKPKTVPTAADYWEANRAKFRTPGIPENFWEKYARGEQFGEEWKPSPADDPINHPKHYTSHPSGVECATIAEHFSYNIGTAIAYLWRHDLKGAPVEDMRKAIVHIQREIARREGK